MEDKSTPGPWLIEGGLVYALDETETANRFSARIEGGYEINYKRGAVKTSEAEVSANARLIAAAPDLLQACRVMLACFGSQRMVGMEVLARIDVAREAVEKATGEPS